MKIFALRAEVCGDACMQGYEAEAEMDDGMYVHVADVEGLHYSVTEESIWPDDDCPTEVDFVEIYEDIGYEGLEDYKASKYAKVFDLLLEMLRNLDEEL